MNLARLASGTISPRKKHDPRVSPEKETFQDLSPELVPIVTLMLSQAHRRYYEGIFMLYYDLNGDGKPADREWKEVYGILTGEQLAYWDAAHLAEYRQNPNALLETSAKPNYINFTDSVYNAMKTLPAAKQNLDNVIIVSTTLKNRYIIQLKSYSELVNWYLALRLSSYEYLSLQEAYTAALLSARGSRLLDIRTVLAEKRFDHEDWVSIRYGSGMAWKRCYAVVQPCTSKKKSFQAGRILFFENEQKKKRQLMAVVSNATSVTAVYPQSHMLIDHSTMLKLEGYINFKTPSLSTKSSKNANDDFKNTSIFLMPEQHSSVPGFDTLIRFLIPLLDSFGLYGRPKRLKADRIDPESLLFGLPTLPRVHYLELADLDGFAKSDSMFSWDVRQWNSNIKAIMKSKLDRGYEGCGSDRGVAGAVSSLSSPKMPNSAGNSVGTRSASSSVSRPVVPPKHSYDRSTSRSASSDQLGNGYSSELLPQTTSTNSSKNFNNLKILTPATGFGGAAAAVSGTVGAASAAQGATSGGAYSAPGGITAGIPAFTASAGSLSAPAGNSGRKSTELADIYQKYLTLKTPSDQFRTNRNELLDRSPERIDESALPAAVQSLNLAGFSYPKDDLEFSDDDGDSALEVPTYNQRNSSYSSVQSPTAQYNEFSRQFNSAVDQQKRPLHNLRYELEESLGSQAPAPPPHKTITTSKPSLNLSQNISSVPQGTPEANKGDHLSIHSQTAASGDSSPHSQESERRDVPVASGLSGAGGSQPNVHAEQKASQQRNMSSGSKPKYISLPNITQNQMPSFQVDSAPSPRPYPAPELHVQRSRPQQQQPPNQQQSQLVSQPLPQQYQQHHQTSRPSKTTQVQGQGHYKDQIVPQAPPQKSEYPQSLQFGYLPLPAKPQSGRPNPQAQGAPNYGLGQGYGAQNPSAQGYGYAPGQPQGYQSSQGSRTHRKPPTNHGVPPSVSHQNPQPPSQQGQRPPTGSSRPQHLYQQLAQGYGQGQYAHSQGQPQYSGQPQYQHSRPHGQSQFPQGQPQYAQGQYSQGQYPQGQYPQAQYPQGQHPQGQYSQGQYSQGQAHGRHQPQHGRQF